MPLKGYKQTEEHRNKVSKSRKGKKVPEWITKKAVETRRRNNSYRHTEKTKRKISIANKGRISGMKGKCRSEESKRKMSETMKRLHKEGKLKMGFKKGVHYSPKTEFKKGCISWIKGKGHSKETKEKLGETLKKLYKNKYNHPRYGKHHTEETKKKISKISQGQRRSPNTEFKKGQFTLGKHPNWQGGISFEPYGLDFNDIFKERIRERDNYCCVICNIPQEALKESLSIHHIDYNKKNNFPQNCVSLCRNHHIDTNHNRQYWKTFFQSLLKERYVYEYTQDQKIILDFV